MTIEITGEPRRVMLPKRTQDGRRIELSYTIVPTTHGKLVMFDKFAKKTKPEEVVKLLQESVEKGLRRGSGRVGNYKMWIKKSSRVYGLNSLHEGLILEDLHHNGIRCEPPVAVLLRHFHAGDPKKENFLVTIGSKSEDVIKGHWIQHSIGRKVEKLGYLADPEKGDLQVVGTKPPVVIDVESLSSRSIVGKIIGQNRPRGYFHLATPLRIQSRALRLLHEARRATAKR